jgi:hypothetical protein
MRHVSFRMPADVHQDYVAVAESRGVDLSALLNWVVVDYRPMLLLRRAENEAAMLRAAMIGLPPEARTGPDPEEALTRLKEVIRQLQNVADKLAGHVGGEEKRRAA